MAFIPPPTPALPAALPPAVAEEAARRYLAAFQQLATLTSAGPLVVIGIYQLITSGDSCGICQLISGDSQSGTEALSTNQSLFMGGAALGNFIISLVLAMWGLVWIAQQDVSGGSLSQDFFRELTWLFSYSMLLFLGGISVAAALLLFSV